MKLIINFGDAVVKKMTVVQKLMVLIILILIHRYMSVQPIIEIFGYFHKEAIIKFREVIFSESSQTDAYGIIFSLMWIIEQNANWEYIEHLTEIFLRQQANIYLIKSVSSQESQLYQNEIENRLLHKPSKRDIYWPKKQEIIDNSLYRVTSYEIEVERPNHFYTIENSFSY